MTGPDGSAPRASSAQGAGSRSCASTVWCLPRGLVSKVSIALPGPWYLLPTPKKGALSSLFGVVREHQSSERSESHVGLIDCQFCKLLSILSAISLALEQALRVSQPRTAHGKTLETLASVSQSSQSTQPHDGPPIWNPSAPVAPVENDRWWFLFLATTTYALTAFSQQATITRTKATTSTYTN